jgi:hypothetical protein
MGRLEAILLTLQQLDKALIAVDQGPGEMLPFVCLAGLVE